MYNFSTLFNYKYLANGLLLYQSLSKNLKNFKLYVFAFDNFTYEFLKKNQAGQIEELLTTETTKSIS